MGSSCWRNANRCFQTTYAALLTDRLHNVPNCNNQEPPLGARGMHHLFPGDFESDRCTLLRSDPTQWLCFCLKPLLVDACATCSSITHARHVKSNNEEEDVAEDDDEDEEEAQETDMDDVEPEVVQEPKRKSRRTGA